MRLRTVLFAIAVIAISFLASLWAMDMIAPRAVTPMPRLVELPPLPPVARSSEIVAPVAISLGAIRDALDRAAPRTLAGKADNPVGRILQNADINWTVTRGPLAASGARGVLALSTPLDGKLSVTGSLAAAGGALGNALSGVLGADVARQIGSVSIKSLDANAAIHGTVSVTARPALLPTWRIDPKLAAEVAIGNSSLVVAGAKVAVPAQVKPLIDRTVNEQVAALDQRLRNDRALEDNARREWARLCRSMALPPAAPGMPPLWLEMRPVRATAVQPTVDANAVNVTLGIEAETRVTAAETTPQCPFPATLDIVPARPGHIAITVPVDMSFADVSRILEAELKDRSFPEDGSSAIQVTVRRARVAAAGDRLLISLDVKAAGTAGYFGLGAEMTLHIWGRPVLETATQTLRLTDLELAVESDAALGLVGAAARAAVPYLRSALEQRATLDLNTFAANAQHNIAAAVAELKRNDAGLRVEPALTRLRLGAIAFDSHTLRIVAEAEGTIGVTVTALP